MAQSVKNLPVMQETQEMWVQSLGEEKILWVGNGNSLQKSCLENSKDREADSPWGHKELYTTEQLSMHTYFKNKMISWKRDQICGYHRQGCEGAEFDEKAVKRY